MAEYYEFHDSYLEGIERVDDSIVLLLNAYRLSWDGDVGTGWMQRISLTVMNGVADYPFTSFPVCLMDGDLRAESLEAETSDCLGTMIPGTLSGSTKAEVYLEGYEEDTNEYRTMRICGDSVAITSRGPAKFIENLPAHMNPRLVEDKNEFL